MKALLIITITAAAVLSTSCNTFIGIGRDMRLAGEGMEKVATKASGRTSPEANTSGAPVY